MRGERIVWQRIVSALISLHVSLSSALVARSSEPLISPLALLQARSSPAPDSPQSAPQDRKDSSGTLPSDYDSFLQSLLRRSRHHLQQGEEAYRQGDFARAREEFDRAVDVILEARVDVRRYPVLWSYYRMLIEKIHAYQLDAVMQGSEFMQRYEPALLDQLARIELSPEDLEAGRGEVEDAALDFPVKITPEVRQFIHYFTKNPRGRATMEAGLRRAGRYLEIARRIFQEEGVPLDLVWLAQAESNWRPHARSPMNAQGIWQFIPTTGIKYGLRQTRWLDERSGLEQPTRAAARYLKFLYERYLDWPLALAAYNCGEAAVDRAIAASGYADFWYLHRNRLLPAETRNYVPIILAIIVIAKNPARYGFTEIEPEPALQYEVVPVEGPLDLRLIAEAVGTTTDHIWELNPELTRGVIPWGETYTIRVPAGTAEQVSELLARVPAMYRSSWRIHDVREGETVASIADQHRVSAEEIARVNDLDVADPLAAGSRVIVPTRSAPGTLGREPALRMTRLSVVRITVRARAGDTITRIAARYGISARDVARLNRVSPTARLRAGQKIVLNLPADRVARTTSSRARSGTRAVASSRRASDRHLTHRVRPGDTLSEIASRYDVTVSDLRRWNRLSGSVIRPGQILVIYR